MTITLRATKGSALTHDELDANFTDLNTNKLAAANNLSDLDDAATARANIGLVIGTDVQAYDAQLADIAGLTPNDGSFIVGDGSNFTTESGATARASLGLVIGTDVQAYDSDLASIAALSPSANDLLQYSGGWTAVAPSAVFSGTYQPAHQNLTDISNIGTPPADGAFIVGDGSNFVAESGSTARASLGLTIGTNVQAWDAALDDIAALAVTDGNIIVGDGNNWVAESGATARASLGLTIGSDVQAYDAELAALAGLTSAANKIPMFSGSGTATTIDFDDDDTLAADSDTAVCTQGNVVAYVAANAASTPTGAMVLWTTDTAPTGYLLCYGQAVSRTTYSDLFAVISTTYGVGDGSTTFNLPDMRGRFPLGQDDMGGTSADVVTAAAADSLGGTDGEEDHTLSEAELAAHTHSANSIAIPSGTYAPFSSIYTTSNRTTTSAGSDSAHNNMPPYMTVNYVIKT